jgi:hypothetical protein
MSMQRHGTDIHRQSTGVCVETTTKSLISGRVSLYRAYCMLSDSVILTAVDDKWAGGMNELAATRPKIRSADMSHPPTDSTSCRS